MYEEDPTDEVQKRTSFLPNTGGMYGFNVPKAGVIVFKTNAAREPTAPVRERAGEECIIISSASAYLKKLKQLSEFMATTEIPGDYLTAQGYIFNTKQACTVLNLTLRYLDAKRAGKKRWFFRPLAAFYAKHLGHITKEAQKLVTAAAAARKEKLKEQKKQERAIAADARKAAKKAERAAEKAAGKAAKPKPDAAPAAPAAPAAEGAPASARPKPRPTIKRTVGPKTEKPDGK